MIDFTNLTDPTYNQPITNVFHQGCTFRIDTADRIGPTVTFKDLQWVIENGKRLKQRIAYYQDLINAGANDKETNLARTVIDCAKRHSLVYDRIYIPLMSGDPAPDKSHVKIHELMPEPVVQSNGQFSMF